MLEQLPENMESSRDNDDELSHAKRPGADKSTEEATTLRELFKLYNLNKEESDAVLSSGLLAHKSSVYFLPSTDVRSNERLVAVKTSLQKLSPNKDWDKFWRNLFRIEAKREKKERPREEKEAAQEEGLSLPKLFGAYNLSVGELQNFTTRAGATRQLFLDLLPEKDRDGFRKIDYEALNLFCFTV